MQWAEAAARVGHRDRPGVLGRQGKTSQDFVGVAVTYAGVGGNPLAFRIRTERFRTLVILDEVHHAGDALSAGARRCARRSSPAHRRLALTGTPFRSDINPIPFVTYAPGARRRRRGGAPTTPTATARRWPTTSSGRCCSWRTPARCSGAPGRATRSRPGSASR